MGVSQIHPPVSGVKFSNNMSIPPVWVNIKKTEHDATFEISKLIKPFGEKLS